VKFASLRRFDNRYTYPICRFPSVERLEQLGICRTVWLPGVPPDLWSYAERLEAAGLAPIQLPATVRARAS
jgi:hypothetical protein